MFFGYHKTFELLFLDFSHNGKKKLMKHFSLSLHHQNVESPYFITNLHVSCCKYMVFNFFKCHSHGHNLYLNVYLNNNKEIDDDE